MASLGAGDLETALKLAKDLSTTLPSDQLYRMDHYLGKEGVRNLVHQRMNCAFFEPLWNHHYIDNVQITLSEQAGIAGRGGFWEETGTLRDLLQNHLLQLLALVAMDLPQDGTQISCC